jgi:hypothetical protein
VCARSCPRRVQIHDEVSNRVLSSNAVHFDYVAPRIGNVVNSISLGVSVVECPVFDPFNNAVVPADSTIFVLTLHGFNFGPPRPDGKGPKVLSGFGSATARSTASGSHNQQSLAVLSAVCVAVCGFVACFLAC